MKRAVFCLIFGLVLTAGLASAISLEMQASYKAKESVSAKIAGNILEPITKSQIVLKRGQVETAVDFDVKRLGSDYYIWLITPANAAEYTLRINGMYATISGEAKRLDFAQNFTVTNETSDYYVKPGFVYTSSDFTMTSVLGEDARKEISADFPEPRILTLEPGENKFTFSISSVKYTGLYTMNFGKYKIPAYIITGKNAPAGVDVANFTQGEENKSVDAGNNYSLRIIPGKIKREVYTGDEAVYPITLKNNGGNDITALSAEYDRIIFDISKIPDSLNAGEEIEFNISVANTKDYVNDGITFFANGAKFYLSVEINFTSDKSAAKYVPFNNSAPNFYCEELIGKICAAGEGCSGEIIQSKNGACCSGGCTAAESEESSSWIGWIIAAAIVGGIGFLYYRYKKVHKEEDLLGNELKNIDKKITP